MSTVWRFLSLEHGVLPRDSLYYSPEEMRSVKRVGRESDIWSIGVTLFELLQGRLPFVGGDLAVLRGQILRAEAPATPIELPFAGELDRILARALAKEAENRYPSARELAADLETLIPKIKKREEDD
jgi:eukaryotic-like serine/threonine-protein kinase